MFPATKRLILELSASAFDKKWETEQLEIILDNVHIIENWTWPVMGQSFNYSDRL